MTPHERIERFLDDLIRSKSDLVRYVSPEVITAVLKEFLTLEPPSVSAPPAQAWQPIATAPKDGTRLLLALDGVVIGEFVSVGYWDAYYAEGGRGHTGGDGWVDASSSDEIEPTHWMPLPRPPAQAPTDDDETPLSRVDGVPRVGHGDLPRNNRNGVLTMDAKHIAAFVAQRLRDVASFNGCFGTEDGVCCQLSPDDPVEWCKYCVQGYAAQIIEASL